MYCPECGCKIEEGGVVFCPECGTKVYDTIVQQSFPNEETVNEKGGVYANGIILTNVELLAEKMAVSPDAVQDLLVRFMDAKRQTGVSYRLVDAGNYTYSKKNFLGRSKTVHLKADSKLDDYMEILADVHNDELDKGFPESQYLFIIGGDDIIPMPCVPHYSKDVHDKTIDTDILYSYPYGSDMLALLESMEIFEYEPVFLVGRLPVSDDTTLSDLQSYLDRDVQNSEGIPLTEAYGQCDPHWKNVSATVATDLIGGGLFRDLEGSLPIGTYFRKLILSPEVNVSNVYQVFHPDASLLYFNLHGAEALESRGYFGESMLGEMQCTLLPEHLATCRVPNVIMCEACYGARFIGMDKPHSMLLTSLYASSLLFVGSSRIAWGNVDPTVVLGYTPVAPFFADVIALEFMKGLLEGYTAGEAMLLARSMVFQQDDQGIPNTPATIVEFNLFGDPTLGLAISNKSRTTQKAIDKSIGRIKGSDYGCVMEKVEMDSVIQSESVLQQVRQAVDANLSQIHDMVGCHLYAQYGISPRPASSIFRLNYANGKRELSFSYEMHADSSIPITYIVRTSEKGEIKSVITTR